MKVTMGLCSAAVEQGTSSMCQPLSQALGSSSEGSWFLLLWKVGCCSRLDQGTGNNIPIIILGPTSGLFLSATWGVEQSESPPAFPGVSDPGPVCKACRFFFIPCGPCKISVLLYQEVAAFLQVSCLLRCFFFFLLDISSPFLHLR